MLLSPALQEYLGALEKAIHSMDEAYVELYEEEIITEERLNIRLRIRIGNGFLLELNEAVFVENQLINHIGYRYHFQDERNRLIFRYDDTPHFPKLNSFPNHKHLKNGVVEANKHSILAVISEALKLAILA